MAKTHVVQQGEHLSGIASQYGFASYTTIWDHPQNAQLKEERGNPNVLLPGDKVFIPDKQPKSVSCPTGRRYRFQVHVEKLHLRFTLQDFIGQPVEGTPCQLVVEGRTYDLTTDADGKIDIEIPKSAQSGMLKFNDVEIPVKIGHLDPVGADTGVSARLTNLGYYHGPQDPIDEMELRSAIEEFQCDQELEVTGECDAETQAKLEEVHGC